MSASVDEISNVIVNGVDGDDEEDEDDEEDTAAIGGKLQCRRRRVFGKAKEEAMRQFTKARTRLRRIRSRRALLRSSSSSSTTAVNASSGKVIVNGTESGSGRECKFCFSRPSVLESPDGSPASDPNDPNFTHAMLRVLIENNDFYSKECNPHLD